MEGRPGTNVFHALLTAWHPSHAPLLFAVCRPPPSLHLLMLALHCPPSSSPPLPGDAIFARGPQHGHFHPEDALGDQLPPARPHHVRIPPSTMSGTEEEMEGKEEEEGTWITIKRGNAPGAVRAPESVKFLIPPPLLLLNLPVSLSLPPLPPQGMRGPRSGLTGPASWPMPLSTPSWTSSSPY